MQQTIDRLYTSNSSDFNSSLSIDSLSPIYNFFIHTLNNSLGDKLSRLDTNDTLTSILHSIWGILIIQVIFVAFIILQVCILPIVTLIRFFCAITRKPSKKEAPRETVYNVIPPETSQRAYHSYSHKENSPHY